MDVEAEMVPVVQAAFTAAHVVTSTPNDLDTILPAIKLLDTGGRGDTLRLDRQGIEVDVFHTSKSNASSLAWDVYHWFMESLPLVLNSIGVRRVDDSSLPIETSYQNPAVWRYTFNVSINTHDRSI